MPEVIKEATSTGKKLPTHAKVVIIGGGVVGCSILFHLAKFGWKDAVLLERDELTSGSSWHAAGQIHTISSDPNISRLQSYTIGLYKEIEELSGQSVGLHMTGGFYLASNKTWYDYLKRERSKARYMGLQQEFISLQEVAERHPLIDPKHYLAALWDDQDGDLDPSGTTYAFAKAARHYGAQYFTHTPATATTQRADGTWDVTTPHGTINAEYIVNCGGLWAREVGHMSGLNFPVQPMEHHDLLTEGIDEIVNHPTRLPCGIDYEANLYFRQERDGMLLGTYEPVGAPWKVEGTPWDFGHELLNPQPRTHRRPAGAGLRAYSGAGQRRYPAGGQWSLHLRPRRQPHDRAGPRHAQLLVRRGSHGRLLPRWGRRPDHGRVDDRRRAFDRCLGHGCGALW